MNRKMAFVRICADAIFSIVYKKLRKILELEDWQPPAVCDNIFVGTFINFENR